MKASAEKSSTSTASSIHEAANKPFFSKAGGGDFFASTKNAAPVVQMKLTVNKVGDKFEQEADRMADKVMRMPDPAAEKLQRQPEEKIQKKEEDKIQKAPAGEDKLQRLSNDAPPEVSANTQQAIQSKKAGGQPLPEEVRGFMEPRFGADFSKVRVHHDGEAGKLSKQLSARAFTHENHVFFSPGEYQPGTSEGKALLAHELTHTVQQGHAIQRSPQISVTATPPTVQREKKWYEIDVPNPLAYLKEKVIDFAKGKAEQLPGFTMLTVVMGKNPISGAAVDRSPGNILEGAIQLIPVVGNYIADALSKHGIFDKVSQWVLQQFNSLKEVGANIWQDIKNFINNFSITQLESPSEIWEKAKNIVMAPINAIKSFAEGLVDGITTFVKDAILKPLAAFAKTNIPNAYALLSAILGSDPISGEAVPPTADNVIGPFMKMIGKEEIWTNIKAGKAIPRAWSWFQGALEGLMGFARSIPKTVINTLKSLTIKDLVLISGAFSKITGAFASVATSFISWATAQVISLLEILFSVVAPGVMPYIKKAQAAFKTILENPIGFVGNLVNAGKLGFQMFASNIGTHLKTALIKWITGPLGEAGVYIPQSFSLIEIIKLVLSVLGLTWQNIRSKLVKIIPEPVLVGIEKTAGILVTLAKDGPAAAWEQIKTELGELKDQLIAQVTQMVTTEVVKAAVAKLVTSLNPAGAVIQAIIAIYNTVTFFIEKASQIGAVVASFINSISAIAAGQIAPAAKRVEQTMANTLTVIIAFLAKIAGLGGIPNKIVGIVKKIRAPIDKGLDKIVAWLGKVLQSVKDKVKSILFKPKTFSVGKESHRLYADGKNVMLASVPARLDGALARFKSANPPPKADILSLIGAVAAKGAKLQKNLDKGDASLEPENNSLRDEIVAMLAKIMYETGGTKKNEMPVAKVDFDVYGDPTEFKRQINMQHVAMNAMKVGDWQKNRARFVGFGRESRSVDSDEKRVEEFAKQIVANVEAVNIPAGDKAILRKLFDVTGKTPDKANQDKKKGIAHAQDVAKQLIDRRGSDGKAVLHTVDQVAGGKATVYGDKEGALGDSKINSSIGSQWKTKISIVDANATDVDATANVKVSLNPR